MAKPYYFLVKINSTFIFVVANLHPAFNNVLMDNREVCDNNGTMLSTFYFSGSHDTFMRHVCVDVSFLLSGRFMTSRFVAGLILETTVTGRKKFPVDIASDMAWYTLILMLEELRIVLEWGIM